MHWNYINSETYITKTVEWYNNNMWAWKGSINKNWLASIMSHDFWSKTNCSSLFIWVILFSFYLATHKLSNHSIFNLHLLYLILSNGDKEKGKYVI